MRVMSTACWPSPAAPSENGRGETATRQNEGGCSTDGSTDGKIRVGVLRGMRLTQEMKQVQTQFRTTEIYHVTVAPRACDPSGRRQPLANARGRGRVERLNRNR